MKRPFIGHIVSGRPVTTRDGRAAGIVKKDPEDIKKELDAEREKAKRLMQERNEQQEKT